MMNKMDRHFSETVWSHYQQHGRDMPWRINARRGPKTVTPYHILVSEIMLQQTQVPRVMDKFRSFTRRFPTFKALANASTADVLAEWQGLGYNRRGVHLKQSAEYVIKEYNGRLPGTEKELRSLPGIGSYTARALQAFAFNYPSVFIETNIRNVFLYHYHPTRRDVHDNELFPLIEKTLNQSSPREWYYALMDYGTSLKAQGIDLAKQSKHYTKQSKFEGSNRQKRSRILQLLIANGSATPDTIATQLQIPKKIVQYNVQEMTKEGLLECRGNHFLPAT